MRKTLTTAALLLALSCPASAGIMHTPPVASDPPAPTEQQSADANTVTTDGLIQTVLDVGATKSKGRLRPAELYARPGAICGGRYSGIKMGAPIRAHPQAASITSTMR